MEKPPEKAVFVAAKDVEKLLMMTNAWIRQTNQLQQCNANFVALQEWKASILETLPEDAQVSNDDRWKDMRRP